MAATPATQPISLPSSASESALDDDDDTGDSLSSSQPGPSILRNPHDLPPPTSSGPLAGLGSALKRAFIAPPPAGRRPTAREVVAQAEKLRKKRDADDAKVSLQDRIKNSSSTTAPTSPTQPQEEDSLGPSIRFAPLPSSGRIKRANSVTIGVSSRAALLGGSASPVKPKIPPPTFVWIPPEDKKKRRGSASSTESATVGAPLIKTPIPGKDSEASTYKEVKKVLGKVVGKKLHDSNRKRKGKKERLKEKSGHRLAQSSSSSDEAWQDEEFEASSPPSNQLPRADANDNKVEDEEEEAELIGIGDEPVTIDGSNHAGHLSSTSEPEELAWRTVPGQDHDDHTAVPSPKTSHSNTPCTSRPRTPLPSRPPTSTPSSFFATLHPPAPCLTTKSDQNFNYHNSTHFHQDFANLNRRYSAGKLMSSLHRRQPDQDVERDEVWIDDEDQSQSSTSSSGTSQKGLEVEVERRRKEHERWVFGYERKEQEEKAWIDQSWKKENK